MTRPALLDAVLVSAPSLDDAYRICRGIARQEAKNFYYAFLALPAAKRNAICAVYAFMRKADDLADDESRPREERLVQTQAWSAQWRRALAEGNSPDPVFVALADAQARFQIPLALLDQLVEGTTMDLAPAHDGRTDGAPDTYQTFDDLYRYCYLVASVVGLVCIRIFGYSNPLAEQLAEELGVAFQLTNILRDVREDAERGRIYLPIEDLQAHGVAAESLVSVATASATPSAALRSLLAFEATRAERFYASGRMLLPLIAPDSRPALWVLVSIYQRLLRRIGRARYDVFSSRIRVPAYEKLAILGAGLCGVLWARILGRVRQA